MVMRAIGISFSGARALLLKLLRAKIVIYDLEKDVRYTLTQKWDRSPESLAVSVSNNIKRVFHWKLTINT